MGVAAFRFGDLREKRRSRIIGIGSCVGRAARRCFRESLNICRVEILKVQTCAGSVPRVTVVVRVSALALSLKP